MKTLLKLIIFVIIVLGSLKLYYNQPTQDNSYKFKNLNIILPLYSDPSVWFENKEILLNLRKLSNNFVVIINPSSGPGYASNYSYKVGIKMLKEMNITVLGYIHIKYGKRDLLSISDEINRYANFYKEDGLDGIFFDEGIKDISLKNKLVTLIDYSKTLGFDFFTLNSGAKVDQKLFDVNLFDLIITYQNSVDSWYSYSKEDLNKATSFSKKGILLYNNNSPLKTLKLIKNTKKNGFEYIYVTNDRMDNPWDTISEFIKTPK